jgi:hypothetical protein
VHHRGNSTKTCSSFFLFLTCSSFFLSWSHFCHKSLCVDCACCLPRHASTLMCLYFAVVVGVAIRGLPSGLPFGKCVARPKKQHSTALFKCLRLTCFVTLVYLASSKKSRLRNIHHMWIVDATRASFHTWWRLLLTRAPPPPQWCPR